MSKIIFTASIFIWVGLLIGISFIETPLKFKAPNITLELGLGIGSLLFNTLNKIEWGLFLFNTAIIFFYKLKVNYLLFILIAFILLLQTLWLLPTLSERVILLINGKALQNNNLHLYFVFFEVLKTLLLIIFGATFLKKILILKQ